MEALLADNGWPRVSVYLPTHHLGRQTAQDPIRLGNLLKAARKELVAAGLRPPQADELLGDAAALVDAHTFWQYQEDGLAVFVAPGNTTTRRLPVSFDEMVVVADAFWVKPLWPLLSGNGLFYVLALSRNRVRLLWADRFRVGEVDLPEPIPGSLAEALWFDDPEKQLQHHAASTAGGGRVVAMFHGHGTPDELNEEKLAMFLRAVDGGLQHLLDPGAPLVLAGVEEVAAAFRRVSRHPSIVGEFIEGNPDRMSQQELHLRATDIIVPAFRRTIESDAAAFLAAGDRGVSTVAAAVAAATAGRVASLFLPLGLEVWGRVPLGGAELEVHELREPGDRDLLDLAAAATWSAGGTVHAVAAPEVPGAGPVAATLRY
jgi:hypothetical protein